MQQPAWRKTRITAGLVVAVAGSGWAIAEQLRHRAPDARTLAAERSRAPAGMVYVPGGFFLAGSDDPDADDEARPRRRVFVPSFYIDRTEVTNAEFRRFRPTHSYAAGEDSRPVTNVTYEEAAAYARWAGKRLPREQEWEKAARGVEGRRYPWGDHWEAARVAGRVRAPAANTAFPDDGAPDRCNVLWRSRLRPVGSVPGGASPYGCLDMAGNAWEWVQGFHNNNPQQRILRGGAVGYGERACRTYVRGIEGAGVT